MDYFINKPICKILHHFVEGALRKTVFILQGGTGAPNLVY